MRLLERLNERTHAFGFLGCPRAALGESLGAPFGARLALQPFELSDGRERRGAALAARVQAARLLEQRIVERDELRHTALRPCRRWRSRLRRRACARSSGFPSVAIRHRTGAPAPSIPGPRAVSRRRAATCWRTPSRAAARSRP